MKKTFLLSLFALFATLLGCEKGASNADYLNSADCSGLDADSNTYAKSIKSILDTHCATSNCHNAASHEDGIDLSTYSKAKNAFENTDCLCSIHHGSSCKAMPEKSGKLDDATIKLIDCWAKNGYKE